MGECDKAKEQDIEQKEQKAVGGVESFELHLVIYDKSMLWSGDQTFQLWMLKMV